LSSVPALPPPEPFFFMARLAFFQVRFPGLFYRLFPPPVIFSTRPCFSRWPSLLWFAGDESDFADQGGRHAAAHARRGHPAPVFVFGGPAVCSLHVSNRLRPVKNKAVVFSLCPGPPRLPRGPPSLRDCGCDLPLFFQLCAIFFLISVFCGVFEGVATKAVGFLGPLPRFKAWAFAMCLVTFSCAVLRAPAAVGYSFAQFVEKVGNFACGADQCTCLSASPNLLFSFFLWFITPYSAYAGNSPQTVLALFISFRSDVPFSHLFRSFVPPFFLIISAAV